MIHLGTQFTSYLDPKIFYDLSSHTTYILTTTRRRVIRPNADLSARQSANVNLRTLIYQLAAVKG